MALLGKKTADASAPAKAPAPPKARKVKAAKPAKSGAAKGGTVVGLNIGNAFIKAVEVTSKGGQLSVTGMGVIATPPESYSNGNVLSVTALSNAIRSMWRQAGLSSRATIFSVAGSGSLVVRVIEVPKMTDGELADNMRVDADRYIPFPPSEVVMDFRALRDLPSDPDAANMEVLLAAAQREIIDLHVAVVQKAKLTPRAIDVEPLALARTMNLDLRAGNPIIDYDDVTAVLNIGQTGTEISILRGDIVVFTRTVPNGGGNLTRAIAETMGIPTSDAERLKIERGDALPPAGYGASAGDDFGDFGDFGDANADFSSGADFGDDFGVGAVTAAPTTKAANSATASSSSDDPFDLDFFNDDPQQAEPGAGHGQKEDDETEKPAGINFSSGDLDDDLAPSIAGEATPASSPIQASGAAPQNLENLDLDDAFLPALDAPAAEQSASPVAASSMPSAFDFSDFDLPTIEETASAPATNLTAPTQKLADNNQTLAGVAADVATPAPTSSFGFGFSDTPPLVAEPQTTEPQTTEPAVASSLSFEKADDEIVIAPTTIEPETSEPAISLRKTELEATQSEPVADNNGFDLDDVFGDANAPAAPVAATPVAADDEFGADVFGGSTAENDFDVSALNMATGESDDFTSFGTGLSQTGETDDATLYAAMQPVLEDLATEVRRSLEFHLGRYPDTTFSRLVLVGGGAKLRNLDEFLAGNLGVPTSVGDPFAHIKINAPGLPTEFAPTNAPLCAVALGLALREFIE